MTETFGASSCESGRSSTFESRHIGCDDEDRTRMLRALNLSSLDALSNSAIPDSIRYSGSLSLQAPITEDAALVELRTKLGRNRSLRSFIGMGYVPAVVPAVIRRGILENPGWYTQYTPYQAEISQGRLEALLNFQTIVASLTGLPIANASLLDEATAAAEAMVMCRAASSASSRLFVVDKNCHPQTIDVVFTRAQALGIALELVDPRTYDFAAKRPYALLAQYPGSDGTIVDPREYIVRAKNAQTAVILATCPLALCLLTPPAELGADVAVGSMQRFGLPLGFGGPHAAYLAARADLVRFLPGRIVGVSKDSAGRTAYRLALQTREQHIRRERALSNICTAQVLPAIAASFYAIYHGPSGLIRIANRIAELAGLLHSGLCELGLVPATTILFDTLRIPLGTQERARTISAAERFNIELNTRYKDAVSVTLGETHSQDDVADLLRVFAFAVDRAVPDLATIESSGLRLPKELRRTTPILEQEVFHRYHSEHELLRYMKKLENRDLSLTTSMIPLGSCTMKLNATAEMLPMTWHEIASMHPYTAQRNAVGIIEVARELSSWLAEVTGMDAVSLQPNSGAQGEYAGLLAIRAYHEKRQDSRRTICLVPTSAHGTNPASAVLAGLQVVTVACDSRGNVDLDDLHTKIAQHQNQLAAIMITYPSTHGVFESSIRDVCDAIHSAGGLVYLDGANLNAQVGLCRPGDFGADVCHINLHKTFCIPHGGGGPGMGPIAVRDLLADYLPGHRDFTRNDDVIADDSHIRMVSAAPYGSGSLLPISWMYIRMMGAQGLRRATQQALLNANYMAYRLSQQYAVLFRGSNGFCAHEFIIDLRAFKKTASIEVDDVAKRLMDYGFHAPTVSFPVPGTLMIEPTESESLSELDRFCDALLAIREEIREIELGQASPHDNVLKGAPHTAHVVCADAWSHPYTRERAAYPSPHTRDQKFWPSVGRVDAAAGDRHLVCTRELPASL